MTSRTSVRSLCALFVCAACVQSPPKPETAAAEAAPTDASLARAQAFSDALARGNIDEIGSFYDDKALMVGPASLSPVTSREGVLAAHQALMQKEKVVYYHLRQPRAAAVDGQTSLLIANYERGATQAGRLTETNGKVLYILSGPQRAIAAEVIVPNVNTGTYGPMGTALTARPWGKFPARAVPPPGATEAGSFASPWEKQLFDTTLQINATFPKGSIDGMLAFADDKISIWAGDYGPVYIWGADSARTHFADFFRSGKMGEIRAFRPVIREFGGVRMVYFQFEETLTVENELRRNPGQATYTFIASTGKLAACTETGVVARDIGDPYVVP